MVLLTHSIHRMDVHDGCDNWWNPVQEWTVEARDTLDPNEQREINRGEDETTLSLDGQQLRVQRFAVHGAAGASTVGTAYPMHFLASMIGDEAFEYRR